MINIHPGSGKASQLPFTLAAGPVRIYSPVTIPLPNRAVDLQVRVTSPSTGTKLPIVLISHGHGRSKFLSSLHGYSPLAEYYAAHGFVVLQPTHLSSATLGLAGNELHWDTRPGDMSEILNHMDLIENQVPELRGRLDADKVAVVGHSLGGMTASMLLGATNTDPRDQSQFDGYEGRIKAGIIIGGTGSGKHMSESGKALAPFYDPDFGSMRTRALVVAGDEDQSPHLTVRDESWHVDPYTLGPGPKDLLLVKGCRHTFGGISGFDVDETQEDPERSLEMLALMQMATSLWLRNALYGEKDAWDAMARAMERLDLATTESKV